MISIENFETSKEYHKCHLFFVRSNQPLFRKIKQKLYKYSNDIDWYYLYRIAYSIKTLFQISSISCIQIYFYIECCLRYSIEKKINKIDRRVDRVIADNQLL